MVVSARIGETLGPYRLVSELGPSGPGLLYRAYDPPLGRYVALEVLPPEAFADSRARARFLETARRLARLPDHPNILKVFAAGEEGGRVYVARRLVEGPTLDERLAAPVSPAEVARIVEAVAAALDHAHRHGICHGDPRPANVLLDDEGEVYLAGFGGLAGADAPEYQAPEQLSGAGPLNARTDVYGLGVLLYRMLAGRTPFGGDRVALIGQHAHLGPPPLEIWGRPAPPGVQRIVQKALARGQLARYSSPGALARELRQVVQRELALEPAQAALAAGDLDLADRFVTELARTRADDPDVRALRFAARRARERAQAAVEVARLEAEQAERERLAAERRAGEAGRRAERERQARAAHEQRERERQARAAVRAARAPRAVVTVARLRRGRGRFEWRHGLVGAAAVLALVLAARVAPSSVEESRIAAPTAVIAASPSVSGEAAVPTAAPPPTVAATRAAPTATLPLLTPTASPAERLRVARTALEAGQHRQALDLLAALRQTDAATPGLDEARFEAHLRYASFLLGRDDPDGSLAQVDEALRLRPGDAAAQAAQGRATLAKHWAAMEAAWGRDEQAAVAALDEIMRLDPAYREAGQKLYALLIARADRLLTSGDRSGALAALQRAREVNPDGMEARERLTALTPTPLPTPTRPPVRPTVPPFRPAAIPTPEPEPEPEPTAVPTPAPTARPTRTPRPAPTAEAPGEGPTPVATPEAAPTAAPTPGPTQPAPVEATVAPTPAPAETAPTPAPAPTQPPAQPTPAPAQPTPLQVPPTPVPAAEPTQPPAAPQPTSPPAQPTAAPPPPTQPPSKPQPGPTPEG